MGEGGGDPGMHRLTPAARRWLPVLCCGALGCAVLGPGAAALGAAPVTAPAPPPLAGSSWYGDTAAGALAAVGGGSTINLFYGAPLSADAWLQRDAASLSAGLADGTATLGVLYNQWLAIADLRAAVYESQGQLAPDGVDVYPPGASAVAHALDLALWARETALLAALGAGAAAAYPSAQDLGYRDSGTYIDPTPVGTTVTPGAVAAAISGLGLPAALFAGDRILLMPYQMPEEYGLTDVIGPDIRIWLGADASVDLPHVLFHELGHAIHFRFGGYDTTVAPGGGTRPLSAFWQQYLSLRGLAWGDPMQVPWAQQTPECFAEDVAALFDGPADLLGFQAACPAPTASQQAALLALLRGLSFGSGAASPFQQAGWLQWSDPWPNACMGYFEAYLFTAEDTATVGLALDANATGGPYTVELAGQSTPLVTMLPGGGWTGSIALPPGGSVEVDADSPTLILSAVHVYQSAAFVPVPRISGVFSDTLDDWSRADVAAGVRAGIVGGYPDGTFRPEAPVTRAEFARILATALPGLLFASSGIPSTPWPDVPPTLWAAPFVSAVGGYLPGTAAGQDFLPNQALTRQEAAAWLTQAFGWTPLEPGRAAALLATYPDGAQTASTDLVGFATAVNLGLVVGDAGTGDLRPAAALDRAEATIMVLRAMDLAPAAPSASTGGPSAGAAALAPASSTTSAAAPASGGAG